MEVFQGRFFRLGVPLRDDENRLVFGLERGLDSRDRAAPADGQWHENARKQHRSLHRQHGQICNQWTFGHGVPPSAQFRVVSTHSLSKIAIGGVPSQDAGQMAGRLKIEGRAASKNLYRLYRLLVEKQTEVAFGEGSLVRPDTGGRAG